VRLFLYSHLALQLTQMQDYADTGLFSLAGTGLWYVCHARGPQQYMPLQIGEINANLAFS